MCTTTQVVKKKYGQISRVNLQLETWQEISQPSRPYIDAKRCVAAAESMGQEDTLTNHEIADAELEGDPEGRR
jgi:hypothetical protein